MRQELKLRVKNKYYVYILECSDKTLYTGYTTHLNKRMKAHNAGKGAKYTRGRKPVKLIWSEEFQTLSEALKKEINIKKLSKKEKLQIISQK
ncbi:MAG: GIY-YIG nuclease family protein [bacterium]|nr:GIY-YIG nuclease family protein [bacterium]